MHEDRKWFSKEMREDRIKNALERLSRKEREFIEKAVNFEYQPLAKTSFLTTRTTYPDLESTKPFIIVLNGKATVQVILHEIGHVFVRSQEEYAVTRFANKRTGNFRLDKWMK
jgi:hypothetical protein